MTNEELRELQETALARAAHEECEDDEKFFYQFGAALLEMVLRLPVQAQGSRPIDPNTDPLTIGAPTWKPCQHVWMENVTVPFCTYCGARRPEVTAW